MVDQQVLREIVEQAARAPSIHNTQPWRFVARGDVLELWTDPSRGLAVLDPTGRARHLSCGAALLHARVAAAGAGLAATVTLLPRPDQPEHLADLRLVEVEPPPEDRELAGAIAARRTTRAPFSEEHLPRDVVSALRHAAELEGCWLRVVEDREDAAGVAVLLARSDDLQAADPAYRDELRRWTGAADDKTEGIPDSAVPSRPPSARGSNYRLRDFVADRDEHPTAAPDEPPTVERPLIAVLGTREDDVEDWLAAGQGVGRLLLAAAAKGVTASPMTQPLEIPDTRQRLVSQLGLVGHAQMILRLGYAAEEPAPATPRRPVADILTEEPGQDQ
ncbi:MAG: nitroreductase family protein [Sporichthyaceae bacterium]